MLILRLVLGLELGLYSNFSRNGMMSCQFGSWKQDLYDL